MDQLVNASDIVAWMKDRAKGKARVTVDSKTWLKLCGMIENSIPIDYIIDRAKFYEQLMESTDDEVLYKHYEEQKELYTSFIEEWELV